MINVDGEMLPVCQGNVVLDEPPSLRALLLFRACLDQRREEA
jgi:hypothetical protein